jgi:hypothetical protein
MICMDRTEQCKNFSNPLGFGLMDAGTMVRLALNWTTVPEQMICMDGTASTGPQFQNRWYVWIEQNSVKTLAIPLVLD